MTIEERSFQFAVEIVKFCRKIEKNGGIPEILMKQLIRAGTSIGANVTEAEGGQTKADFTAKMSIAKKEARETFYWLRLLESTEIVSVSQTASLRQQAGEITAILTAIEKTATMKRDK
jgi:four helix bundle protein